MPLSPTLITSPDQFSPVNTDGLWFQLQSASYSEPNYKYVVNVRSWNLDPTDVNGTQSLGQFLIPPRPSTGNGIFTPHQILKSQISNSPITPIYATGINLTYGSMIKYDIAYGYSVDPQINIISTTGVGGNLAINIGFNSAGFNPDDILTLQMDNSKVNPDYNGQCVVLGTSMLTYIVTDIPFGTPQTNETGQITNWLRTGDYVDAPFSGSQSGWYAWNAIRQYEEKWENFGTSYEVNSNVTPFLTEYEFQSTSIPANIKPTRLGQYETIGVLINGSKGTSYQVDKITYYGWNSGSIVQGPLTLNISNINYKGKFEVGIGPQNILDTFTAADMSIIDSYRVFLSGGVSARTNIWRRIDRECTIYDVVQLMFLNRLGSYEYWNFTKVSKETLKTNRVEWKRELDWNYQVGDRQQSILSQQAEKTYVINTDIISQYDYRFLNQLITSPEVYRISGTYSIPIIITDTSWVEKTQLTDGAFNLTINYKDAQNFRTQNQ